MGLAYRFVKDATDTYILLALHKMIDSIYFSMVLIVVVVEFLITVILSLSVNAFSCLLSRNFVACSHHYINN